MNEDADTWLLDHNPAKLLPFSKRLTPEDPDVQLLGRRFMRDSIVPDSDAPKPV
jgi:hypothetical protein